MLHHLILSIQNIKKHWQALSQYWRGLLIVFLAWGGYFFILWSKMLFWTKDGIMAGWIGVYGDWAAHFSYAAAFAYRPFWQWFIGHPLYLGRKFTYPFVADAISGTLIKLGFNEVSSFIIPSFFLSLILIVALYTFYYRVLKSAGQAMLAVTLFFASGGLGGWWVLKMVFSQGNILGGLWFPPVQSTNLPDHSIEWINVITGQLVPQRALLLGVTVGLILITILYHWFEREFKETSLMVVFGFGMVSGLIVVIHPHAYIAFIMIVTVMAIYSWRHWHWWLWLVCGIAVVAPPLYLLFYGGEISQGFMRWYPGWLSNPASYNTNIFIFWLFNWGLFLPTALFATWRFRYYRNPLIMGGSYFYIDQPFSFFTIPIS